MVIVLEGPDNSGKSTAFWELRKVLRARYLQLPTPSREMAGLYPELESRELAFWGALYDHRDLVICDRSVFTSGPVYARLYGRKPPEVDKWRRYVRVVYFDAPVEVLRSRGGDSLFDQANYERVVELYYEELAKFVSVTVDATQSVETVVGECLSVIDRWQQDAEWRQR